jgi:hypothetical protein
MLGSRCPGFSCAEGVAGGVHSGHVGVCSKHYRQVHVEPARPASKEDSDSLDGPRARNR